MTIDPTNAMASLLDIMARLRDPVSGCSWDQAQTFRSIAPYTVDEAAEVAAEIEAGPDPERLKDELGDLLLQVVFHSRLAEELGWFDFNAVATAIGTKMLRRHPHVFGAPGSAAPGWEQLKREERRGRAELGALAGVPEGLPALGRAVRLTKRAAETGFDWPDAAAVLEKLEEEAGELRAELPAADPVRLADEVGDLLFVLANLARKLGLDPEACLHGANAKFSRRFAFVETELARSGQAPSDSSLAVMEAAWAAAKEAGL